MAIKIRQVLGGAVALLLSSASHAAVQSIDGQYLSLAYDDAALPAGFSHLQLRETPIEWDCSSGACAIVGAPSVSIVFGTADGSPVAVTSQALNFAVVVSDKPTAADVIDPLGQHWGIAAVDDGKWTIGVDIASQTPPPGDRQFASAYGQFAFAAPFALGRGVIPSWSGALPISGSGATRILTGSTVLGLAASGEFGIGPGHEGRSNLQADGNPDPNAIDLWDWKFTTQLDGARYAYPSTTDVHCASLSCMSYQTGTVNVSDYFLKFDVLATATAVPEAGTQSMLLLGVGAVAWGIRRGRSVRA